MISVISDCYF